MKTSVVLATYRGSRYIDEQLRSITNQQILPDEIVIFDDASRDETFRKIRYFTDESLVPVVARQQEHNVGLILNFQSGLTLATGDLIILADQDDIWGPDKVARIRQAFLSNPDLGLVFSDANLVDADRQPLPMTLWESLRFSQPERSQIKSPNAFPLLLRRFLVTGATMAFRREHLDAVLPLSPHLVHDAWIALVISAVSRIGLIESPLIDYRQHAGQQIGERNAFGSWCSQLRAARGMTGEYFQNQLAFFEDLSGRLKELQSCWIRRDIGELTDAKISHLRRRIAYRNRPIRSLPRIASEWSRGEYSRFSYGWKSAAQDLFL